MAPPPRGPVRPESHGKGGVRPGSLREEDGGARPGSRGHTPDRRTGHSTRSDFQLFCKVFFTLRSDFGIRPSDFQFLQPPISDSGASNFASNFGSNFLGALRRGPTRKKIGSKNRIQNWIHFLRAGGPALRGTILEHPFTEFVIKNRFKKSAYRSSGRIPCATYHVMAFVVTAAQKPYRFTATLHD